MIATPSILRAGLPAYVTPVRVAFSGSLLLSIAAIHGSTINRDGILYVETARVFLDQGLQAAMGLFAWPFLPVLMALVSQITGLGIETAGLGLCALFMAGSCALFVACANRAYPEAIWPICLVTLAVPGFNEYRSELLREYGSWFFTLLAFLLALRWSERPKWGRALLAQLALFVAALFRPEALAHFATFALWQWFAATGRERWIRTGMLCGLPLLGMLVLLALYADGELMSARLVGEFKRFELAGFDAKAAALGGALSDYARDQAKTILILGSIGLVPLKFISKMGIFLVPFAYAFARGPAVSLLAKGPLFAWAFAVYTLVLAVFALDQQFLAGRYVAPLTLYAAPVAGYGLWMLVRESRRWRLPAVAFALLVMCGNVITFSPPKTHFIEAGAWLAQNVPDRSRVYIESSRAAYAAGWPYAGNHPVQRGWLETGLTEGKYDLVVLEVSRKAPIEPLLEKHHLETVASFADADGNRVIVARPTARVR